MQRDGVWMGGGLETDSSKEDSSSTCFPLELRLLKGRGGGGKSVRVRENGDTRARPYESTEQG